MLMLAAALPLCGQDRTVHDGPWWKSQSPAAKEFYAAGFLDGMALGHNLSAMGAGTSSDPECRANVARAYSYFMGRYFSRAGTDELVAGLDTLYDDPDNDSIILGRAVWIVANRLGGTGKDDIEKLIEQSRGMRY
jgi:hypothetical protein